MFISFLLELFYLLSIDIEAFASVDVELIDASLLGVGIRSDFCHPFAESLRLSFRFHLWCCGIGRTTLVMNARPW